MAVSRSISRRRLCPDTVSTRIDEALAATFYILHQTGPTGFIIKEEGSSRKIKVFLGDPNVCSCSEFKKNHELCRHILWVLLKKFRVPRTNPLIWQLALVEREIDEIILGYLRRQPADQSNSSKQSHDHTCIVPQREIEPEDVCPICQDNLLDSSQSIVYCRFSCGQNIHTKCLKIMADHQKSVSGERPILCPLCREEFGPIQAELSKSAKRLRAEKASLHLGVACSHCHVCPIAGKCYKCVTCVSYHLCHACYSSNQVHLLHPFSSRKHSNQPWRPAIRSSTVPPSDSPALPPALVSSLQSRSLTENDYELLLQLDLPSANNSLPGSPRRVSVGSPAGRTSRHLIGVPERVVNSLHVEPLDGNHPLIVGGASCQICGGEYSRGDWVKKLPCKHKFHRECLQEWLRTNSVCPIDGQSVYNQTTRNKRRLARQTRDYARQRGVIPLTRALTEHSSGSSVRGQSSRHKTKVKGQQAEEEESVAFTVSGQGIGGSRSINTSSGRRRSQRLVKDSDLSLASNGCDSSDDTSLPNISNVTVSSLARQAGLEPSRKLLQRSKRQLTVSIPSAEGSHSGQESGALVPMVSRYTQNDPYLYSGHSHMGSHDHHMGSHDHHMGSHDYHLGSHDLDERGVSLQDYISVSRSPIHSTGGDLAAMRKEEGSKSLSLPSLGGHKPSVVGGGKVIKGSLAHKRKSTAPLFKDCSDLDTSLQVSSFKLCPLPLTNSLLAASAAL